MKHPVLVVSLSLAAMLCAAAHGQTRKCTGTDGKVTYSDVACPQSTASERSVDTRGNTMDGSEWREQAQKNRAAATQAEAAERDRAALETGNRTPAPTPAERGAQQEPRSAGAQDEAAYAACTREVERQGAAEDVKAELFAACRTAGGNQRRTGMAEGTIRECVRSVERTGSPPKDRARQVATCHGADVKPEPAVVIVRPTDPQWITNCIGNQCTDESGQRYTKQPGSGWLRDDGKACQLEADNRVRCP